MQHKIYAVLPLSSPASKEAENYAPRWRAELPMWNNVVKIFCMFCLCGFLGLGLFF